MQKFFPVKSAPVYQCYNYTGIIKGMICYGGHSSSLHDGPQTQINTCMARRQLGIYPYEYVRLNINAPTLHPHTYIYI